MGRKNSLYRSERFMNFRKMLDRAEEKYGGKVAFMYKQDGEIIEKTYKDVNDDTKVLGTALAALGLLNAHVGIISQNSYQWISVYLTGLAGSGVFVPIDRELPFEEIADIISESDCRAVFYQDEYEEQMRLAAEKLPLVEYYINIDKKEEKEEGKFLSMEGLMRRGRRLLQTGDSTYTKCRHDTGKMKMLVYTSGTMGNAKGVMLSEKNLIADIYYGLQIMECKERCLSVLPFHHTYESVCGILGSLQSGATICINEDLRSLMANLKTYSPDYIFIVPAIAESFYKRIWRNAEKNGSTKTLMALTKLNRGLRKMGMDKSDMFFKAIKRSFGGKLKLIICGGAPVRTEVAEFFRDIGIEFINGYGLTECSPLVSVNKVKFNDPASVGVLLPCLECKIDSPDENGEGEICLKGDNVMMGYYKNDIATEAVFEESGWFHTGDLGRLNSSRQLFITGRKKNLIVLQNGKNICPEQIEGYVMSIPYVSEAMVFALRNQSGEEIGLGVEVYLDEEQAKGLTKEQRCQKLKDDINELNRRLPRYKNISTVKIRSTAFEKTATKKIKRINNK